MKCAFEINKCCDQLCVVVQGRFQSETNENQGRTLHTSNLGHRGTRTISNNHESILPWRTWNFISLWRVRGRNFCQCATLDEKHQTKQHRICTYHAHWDEVRYEWAAGVFLVISFSYSNFTDLATPRLFHANALKTLPENLNVIIKKRRRNWERTSIRHLRLWQRIFMIGEKNLFVFPKYFKKLLGFLLFRDWHQLRHSKLADLVREGFRAVKNKENICLKCCNLRVFLNVFEI